jgi:hypothetical protein
LLVPLTSGDNLSCRDKRASFCMDYSPKAPLLKSLAIGLCALSPSGNLLTNVYFTPHGSLLLTTYYLLHSYPPRTDYSLLTPNYSLHPTSLLTTHSSLNSFPLLPQYVKIQFVLLINVYNFVTLLRSSVPM